MAKQLKPNQWIYYFNLYESDYERFVIEYQNQRCKPFTKMVRHRFLSKYEQFKKAGDIEDLRSQTGKIKSIKSPKGWQMAKVKSKYLPEQDLDAMLEILIDEAKHNPRIKDRIEKVINKSLASTRKWQKFGFATKSTIARIKSATYQTNREAVLNKTDHLVHKGFHHFKGTRGRRPIAAWILTTYGIKISAATVGRSLLKQGLKTLTRLKGKVKPPEQKDLRQVSDYVQRDYNNTNHDDLIIATDVTYIPLITKQSKWVYLSVAISHLTKQIISFNLSLRNDAKYIVKHILEIKAKRGTIIHSDHGLQYFSNLYRNSLKQKGWIRSMSAIGNCLDNREVEHWFGVFKSEWLYHQDLRGWSFKKLKAAIAKFIHYYNSQRQQECLGWLTPDQFALKFQ